MAECAERLFPVTEPVTSLADYIGIGGGRGLVTAVDRGPDWVIAELERAGLRGRDRNGVPIGAAWSAARDQATYVVGDATDSEPGAFKDRYLVRRNPYQIMEGLVIAAMCLGAARALIMVNRRFEHEIVALLTAKDELAAADLLGAVPVGLVADDRPESRLVTENVETLAHVPEVLRLGAERFRLDGTGSSPGTTVFTISGDVRMPGVCELPLGFPLRGLIDLVGGGTTGHPVKAVFPGAAGAPLGPGQLDIPLDFDSTAAAGSTLGSSGFVVYDETTCVVAATLVVVRLLCESGVHGAEPIRHCLERIERGAGTARDLDIVASGPADVVRGALARFTAEFTAHLGRACPLPRDLPLPRFTDFDEPARRFEYDEETAIGEGLSA
nr:SLBB domain-containing protein [Kibdelosporangium sp. MJ126-NF4]CEL20046.1 NADH-ubiquinone oxidoreductase chain F [Kibdelosporangium sp. MJ126-NF4]CTQ97270.1 NADH-ubiquinone oxidoreductase chain F (EC 1.6.5.3) [Kibdelosporangium sp. MJ126-NF4]